MEQDTNTNPFPALDSCTFLFRGEQKHTLRGLPIAQQTFDQPWKHACSAVMDNNEKKKVKELAERSADSGHVSCPERPDTISTFRGTRQESEGLES